MQRQLLTTLILSLVFVSVSWAQSTITGQVTSSEDGSPLAGVTVLEKGTNNGAITDEAGQYSIRVGDNAILIFNNVGLAELEESVNGRSRVDVAMQVTVKDLNEVVLTAFGLAKQKKALGYAVTEIDGAELTQAKEVNFVAQLAGKVPGLDITRPTTGPAGSTNIVIRGIGSLTGDNRALIVIDGVPINNENLGSAGMWGGIDTGDGLSSVNPDDIESINVLKGAAAGALYGERGAQGVIVITTKKGTRNQGVQLEYNTNLTLDQAAIFPDFYQREYGQGQNGMMPTTQEEAQQQWRSWGERMTGQPMTYFDGVQRPYSPRENDDVLNYYENGMTWANTVSVSGGNDRAAARLSLSNLTNDGIVPNSGYDRYTVNMLSTLNLSDRLTLEVKANYIDETATNRANLSDNPSNPGKSWSKIPLNISNEMLLNTRNAAGDTEIWSQTDPFTLNPYWGPLEHRQSDHKRRLIGYARVKYDFTDWLSIQGRYAIDWTQHDFLYSEAPGTEHNVNGAFNQDNYEINDNTRDILINLNKRFANNDIGVDVNLGGVQNPRSRYRYNISGNTFIVPGLFNINNMANRNPGNFSISEVQTNGLFATALLDYKGLIYFDGSIRQDWYSTLTNPLDPEASDNTALYGGGSLSFIFSEVLKIPTDVMTFGKLRLSYGVAGNGAPDPYRLLLTYGIGSIPFNGSPLGSISTGTFPNQNLSPTITRSFEAGVDLRFFDNRVGLDVTYYTQNTVDQLFSASLPRPTSFDNFFLNAGDVQNSGWEVSLNTTPVRNKDLRWDIGLNFAANTNEVLALADGIDNLSGESARFNANLLSEVGGMVGSIYGTVMMRNDAGEIIHDANGLPMISPDREILGNYTPDWYGGLTTALSYKNFSLSLLFDTKQGGEIYSLTNAFAYLYGMHPNTLVGRENADFEIVGAGVGPDGTGANTAAAQLDDYYAQFFNAASENIFDASYIKLRQLVIGYELPASIVSKTPFRGVNISFTGRNLFFIQNSLSELGLDPEAVYNLGSSGFEYSSIPSTRSYGFNLNVKF
ncbi:MAG: SusC/RagA family TonB-linked outer membrane protein [Bacteroidota bacterium]